MINYIKIPLIWPFKMVKNTQTPGIHFDDDWACKQIKSFETKAYYLQKWNRQNKTMLQVESTIAPNDLMVIDKDQVVLKSFIWQQVFSNINYNIYECEFDVSDVTEEIIFIHLRANLLSIDWQYVSEPIHLKDVWKNTLLFEYKNSFNKDNVAWSTGISMKFRCEAGIMDGEFQADIQTYVNQIRNTSQTDGVAYRTFKLYIGDAKGVAPYIIDILNRIFSCDYINIEGVLFQREGTAKFEQTRIKNYPLVGASIDVAPAKNQSTNDYSFDGAVAPGIVTAYNIETNFFGPGSIVPIINVE